MIPTLRTRDGSTGPLVVKVRKVLVVDEAPTVRRALLDSLYKLGVPASDMVVAQAAENAMEAFEQHAPSVVFTELVGDPVNGLEMVLEMLEVDPQVRIVLVTAEPQDSPLVRRAVRAGVFSVIEKPLRHDKVRHTLAEIDDEAGGIERFR